MVCIWFCKILYNDIFVYFVMNVDEECRWVESDNIKINDG